MFKDIWYAFRGRGGIYVFSDYPNRTGVFFGRQEMLIGEQIISFQSRAWLEQVFWTGRGNSRSMLLSPLFEGKFSFRSRTHTLRNIRINRPGNISTEYAKMHKLMRDFVTSISGRGICTCYVNYGSFLLPFTHSLKNRRTWSNLHYAIHVEWGLKSACWSARADIRDFKILLCAK